MQGITGKKMGKVAIKVVITMTLKSTFLKVTEGKNLVTIYNVAAVRKPCNCTPKAPKNIKIKKRK